MDGVSRQLAVLHGLYGEVLTRFHTVASGVNVGQRGLEHLIDVNAIAVVGKLRCSGVAFARFPTMELSSGKLLKAGTALRNGRSIFISQFKAVCDDSRIV